jgi:dCMP deaminase
MTHDSCLQCAKLLVSASVKQIKYHFDYNNDPLVSQLLKEWSVLIEQL